jgi:hypothetical protein
VGRKKTNFEQMPGRFSEGTFDRIDAVLESGENRADFLRASVEREIKRRGPRRSAGASKKAARSVGEDG